jgi:hypothetical protein
MSIFRWAVDKLTGALTQRAAGEFILHCSEGFVLTPRAQAWSIVRR